MEEFEGGCYRCGGDVFFLLGFRSIYIYKCVVGLESRRSARFIRKRHVFFSMCGVFFSSRANVSDVGREVRKMGHGLVLFFAPASGAPARN